MLIAGGLLGVPLGKSSLKGDLTDWSFQVVNRHRRRDVTRRRRAAPILQSTSIGFPGKCVIGISKSKELPQCSS
jgi:hypothetical protein